MTYDKTHKIVFTTSQTTNTDPETLEKVWYKKWGQTNFGQSYCCEVLPDEYGGQIVKHTIFKDFDHDPRKQDAGIVHDEIDNWIAEVNDLSTHTYVEVEDFISMNPLR